jgi:hypothetical protein
MILYNEDTIYFSIKNTYYNFFNFFNDDEIIIFDTWYV